LEPILTDQTEIGMYKNNLENELGYLKYPETPHFVNLIYSENFKKNLENSFQNISKILSTSDYFFKENLNLFPLDKDFSKHYN
jgi:CRISPR/Cas system-associated exonuclease Cas4 (RecB family)